MKKISFISLTGLDQFIDPIIEGLSDNYNVRKFIIRTQQEIYNAIDWADIVWLEWCNQTATIGTNYEGIKGKKVIIRLHRYEAFSDFPSQIAWGNVDCLILVASHMIKILEKIIPDIKEKINCEIVYNGIDLTKIKFREREAGFNIAWVGFINSRKNFGMALQILKKLTEGLYNTDKRYILHVAGSFQDPCLKVYSDYMIDEMGLRDNIKFYGWVDDMEKFWEDKNCLLHASIHEAHSYAIMEAMAGGIKPVIHNFRGAKELYPDINIFNTIDEAVNEIMNKDYYSKMYRSWIINKGWTLENQLKKIREVIKEI